MILAVVVLALAFLTVSPLMHLLDERGRLADLREQTEQVATQNDDLQRRVQELSDPSHLEDIARRCLGMVTPGETAFVPVPRDGTPLVPEC